MTTDPALRHRRKQDLLLASALARAQALGAIDQIGQRADRVVERVRQVRAWLSDPRLWLAASAAGSVLALVVLPRLRRFRLLRWGLLAWRTWRAAAPWLLALRAQRQAAGPAPAPWPDHRP
jgi:hypothetical protein